MHGPAAVCAAGSEDLCLSFGPVVARIGTSAGIVAQAMDLRRQVFGGQARPDRDRYDARSLHGVVTDRATDRPLVAFRARVFARSTDLGDSYTAQSYDLTPLAAVEGAILELGRLCQSPDRPQPIALRAAWAALTALCDREGVSFLIGCSSFPGADAQHHAPALAALRAAHLGPKALRPGKRAPLAFDLPGPGTVPGPLPPLLRSYLAMGGWVGDHAVRDPGLDTVHVFTGLRVADIPEARKSRLRALVLAAAPRHPLDAAPAAP